MKRRLVHPLHLRVAVFTLIVSLLILTPGTGLDALVVAQSSGEEQPIVTAIEFGPTQYLSAEDMRSVVTHTRIGEPFNTEQLLKDLWAIHELATERHQQEVFFDLEAELQPHLGGVKVVIYPIEMPVVAGFNVDIDVIDQETFMRYFDIQPGTLLNVQALQAAIEKARESLMNETGYFFVLTGLEIDEASVVHIQLRAVQIASVKLEGNEKTRDYVIEREIESRPGTPLNFRELNGDVRRIFQLRHFNDVQADLVEREDNPLQVDVIYRVQERQTGSAGFGAGWSSNGGFGGYLELADENLFGRGQSASIRWEVAQRSSTYDLSFYEPRVGGTHTSAGFGLYDTRTKSTHPTKKDSDGNDAAYTQRDLGGRLVLGRRLSDYLRASVQLNVTDMERVYEDDINPTEATKKRSLRLGLFGDTTDQPFYPTLGMRYSLETELARNFLGGDTEFTKYEASWSGYRKVGSNDQVLAVRLMGGYSPDNLELQEMFHIGGPDSVRGYDYRTWSGNKMVVGNAEYRFKMGDAIQGVVFADVGRAWGADEEVVLEHMKGSVGVGVRFETPLGIMRLDYGVGEAGGRINFSLGPSF